MNMMGMRCAYSVSWFVLVSLVGVGMESGCVVNPVSGRPELTLISEKQEQELGAEEAKKVEEAMGFADDSGFTPYLNQLGQRLAEHSRRHNVTLQLQMRDLAEPNAF